MIVITRIYIHKKMLWLWWWFIISFKSIWVNYHISLTWIKAGHLEMISLYIHHDFQGSGERREVVMKFTLWWTNIAMENHHF
jgi:hypothetical protein